MRKETFIQEKTESSYNGFGWGGSYDGFGWGDFWGGTSGGDSGGAGSSDTGGGEAPSWADGPSDNPSPSSQRAVELLRVTAGGQLMVDGNGKLIMCRQSCEPRPPLAIYLRRESEVVEEIEARHTACIQCNLVYTQLRPLLTAPVTLVCHCAVTCVIFSEEDDSLSETFQSKGRLPNKV